MTGEMTLQPQGTKSCDLYAQVTFETLIADNKSWMSHRGSYTEFDPIRGPDVKSNGRLEREYAAAIIRQLVRHH